MDILHRSIFRQLVEPMRVSLPWLLAIITTWLTFTHSASWGAEFYKTEFSNFPVGDDQWANRDGWRTTNLGRGWNGIVENAIPGLGRSAFLGYGRPFQNIVRVSHPLGVPVGTSLRSVLRFECLLGLSSSVTGSDDSFALQFYNPAGSKLAGIKFDTGAQTFGIWIDDGLTQIEATALLITDSLQLLSLDIDFKSNRWWGYLDGTTLFENEPFTATNFARLPGAFSFDWQVASLLSPGDNWLLIDDLSIGTPELSISVSRTAGGELALEWTATRAASYQVQISSDASQWSNLPNALFVASAPRAHLRFDDSGFNVVGHRFYRVTQIETTP